MAVADRTYAGVIQPLDSSGFDSGKLYPICIRLSTQLTRRLRGNASDFALTTLRVYSMIGNGQKRGGVDALLRKSPISAFHQGRALAHHIPKIVLRDDKLFFLLTSCSHLPAYEPALSKESIEPNHVNAPSKSSLRSHSCTYFLEPFLQKN